MLRAVSGGAGLVLALTVLLGPDVVLLPVRRLAQVFDPADLRTVWMILIGVVVTALAHHLVSKYTSLVAVDKTPVRPAGKLLAREQVPNLMAHGQSSRAIFGFPATATLGPAMRRRGLLMVLATLLMIAMSARYRRVTHGTQR